jgi:NAD(P)-dependent dehydrogenase (short-subunit alcohol dehydrogenase family)
MTETVFITGADHGLGLALARRFLEAGFRVFAGRYGTPEELKRLGREFPGRLQIIAQNVADFASVRRSARRVAALTPRLEVLINNAGISVRTAQAVLSDLDLTDGHLETVMGVNAFGPLRVTQQFLPLLIKGKRKRIINISSEAGSIADCCRESWFAYSMSKAALNMQSQILQRHLATRGFRVMAVHPGWMRTGMGGPSAAIDPEVTADGVFKLTTRAASPGDPVYVDYTGKPMKW